MRTIFTEESTCEDIGQSLRKLFKKQIVLFACDCALKVLPTFEQVFPNDKRPRKAIEAAINYENYTKQELIKYSHSAWDAYNDAVDNSTWIDDINNTTAVACAACTIDSVAKTNFSISDNFFYASYSVWHAQMAKVKWDWIYDLYTNALNKQSFTKTSDIQGLIQDIKDNRDFGLMPILFDALEDQGLEIDRKEPWGLSHWVLN